MILRNNIYITASITMLLLTLCALNFGCKKLIEVDPPINAIVGSEIYRSDLTAASVLTGIFAEISKENVQDVSLRMGVYGDELVAVVPPNTLLSGLYRNSLVNEGDQLFWSRYYSYIFKANSAIEGLTASTTLSPIVKNHLIGEAKFIRAFLYFYLVNMYGDVPLILTTNPQQTKNSGREAQSKVYGQMVKDLTEAQSLLSDQYLQANVTSFTDDRLRPNKAAATALLSRVYLFTEKWALAETEASRIIQDSRFMLESVGNTFSISSKEAIWKLQSTDLGLNTYDARYFVLKASEFSNNTPGPNGSDRPVYLNSEIYDSFENDDQRKVNWTDTVQIIEPGTGTILQVFPYAYKYKAWKGNSARTENMIVFRLSEQFLIRAEARAKQGKLGEASDDLFEVRKRAGLLRMAFMSADDAVDKIIAERRCELFTEFGHRWFDLKRTGKLNQVMSVVTPLKGGAWQDFKALLPLPAYDLRYNPNLKGHQNPGYLEN